MYTLFTGLYKQWTQKEEFYVIILGLDNAGKTTLLEKIKSIFLGVPGLPPEKIGPTVGLNMGKVDIASTRLTFWDLGGQRELHSIWSKYYSECHAIVFVVDACDRERLEEVKTSFESVITNDEVEGVPVLMLANKQDVPSAMRMHEIKEVFNPIAVQLGAKDSKVLGVSALKGDGVKDAVDWLFVRLQRNKVNRPPVFTA
ncbi:ADP-ribosylation factor family-domain-containing protein [Fimicolochytrium jonesii]|uniref:ADP-ribosylation factor family-domain-containing protein n=1 Tax=Fimicolochytrium jonesii TaxID=1396493 RepID=UPI0022FE91AB|nr:ADP-ribosylation factor family-domain-containing protein [Fimicolochytrium jonesii]KAI8821060.1 ADP-ribosylation factor family-domain-containing protein [Fimicolochytrium jonesii]